MAHVAKFVKSQILKCPRRGHEGQYSWPHRGFYAGLVWEISHTKQVLEKDP
jgi:hypothetical protein